MCIHVVPVREACNSSSDFPLVSGTTIQIKINDIPPTAANI